MDVQLLELLQQTIKVASPTTSLNAYGETTWSSASSVSARISGKQVMIRNKAGQEIVSSKQIIVASSSITERSKVWLPGESTGSPAHPVESVATSVDEDGDFDHLKLWL